MGDLKSPALMYLKAAMFAGILMISVVLLLVDAWSWRNLVLCVLIIWSSARIYYFMFYVIEKYIDPEYKFSGIFSFMKYLLRRK